MTMELLFDAQRPVCSGGFELELASGICCLAPGQKFDADSDAAIRDIANSRIRSGENDSAAATATKTR